MSGLQLEASSAAAGRRARCEAGLWAPMEPEAFQVAEVHLVAPLEVRRRLEPQAVRPGLAPAWP